MVDRTKVKLDGAVATQLGWVNPKTGELLVSIRGLSGAVEWDKKTNTFADDKVKKAKPKKEKATVVEEVVTETPVIVEEKAPVVQEVAQEAIKALEETSSLQKEEAPAPTPKKTSKKKTSKKTDDKAE